MRAGFGAALLLLASMAAGCGGVPAQVEGTVRYREAIGPRGRGLAISVTTIAPTVTADLARAGATGITAGEMSALLADLDDLGLFSLAGRPEAPREIPPGSILVDTSARKFFVTLADLRTVEDATRFSRSASRVFLATQGGPHYALPR